MKPLAELSFAIATLLTAALPGCGKPQPVIVLDSGWSVDSARSACTGANDWYRENAAFVSRFGCERIISCQPMKVVVDACLRDPDQQVREFESELANQLAATPECKSIRLINHSDPDAANRIGAGTMRKHWSLGLDFSPGAPKQQWTMMNSTDQVSLAQGEGDPHEIATRICEALRQPGAS